MGPPVSLYFMHVNTRHHSLAIAQGSRSHMHHLMTPSAIPPVCSEDKPIRRFNGMLTTPRRRDECHQPPALVHKIGASSGECGLRSVLILALAPPAGWGPLEQAGARSLARVASDGGRAMRRHVMAIQSEAATTVDPQKWLGMLQRWRPAVPTAELVAFINLLV